MGWHPKRGFFSGLAVAFMSAIFYIYNILRMSFPAARDIALEYFAL